MAKSSIALFAVVLAVAVLRLQAVGQEPRDPNADLKTAFFGSALTCSQPEKVVIPKSVVKRARLKARLLNLLRESIYDDSKGIVNTEREKEIADVANKLKQEKVW